MWRYHLIKYIVNVEINHNICPVSAKIVSGLFQHLAVSKDLSIIFLFLVFKRFGFVSSVTI